ncbi:MAG TPA: glycosyltransferase family 4 protein [Polyangiaceae bacterium]|nr:glycosyltransferase family 4 protein [Polyangiaceae bacterium]
MRRILYLNTMGVIGGQEVVLLDIVRGLDPARYQTVVASLFHGDLTDTLRAEGRAAHVLPPHRLRHPLKLGRTLTALAMLLRRERIDLIHVNGDALLFYAALAALPWRLPCVWHVHEPVQRRGIAYVRFFYETQRLMRPAWTISNTEAVRESYIAAYPRLGPSTAITPSVDVASFTSGADAERARRRFALPSGAPLLLVIGRLQRSKGQREAIEALVQCTGLPEPPHLVLCGGPPHGTDEDFPAELRALARDLGVEARVHFVGAVTESEKRDLLAACTAFVHPARREAFGIVVIEGMAAGKPVIVTAAAGPKSIVHDTGAGEIVPPEDPGALAKAITRVLGDPARAARMGELGRNVATERYDTRAMVRRIESVYDAVLAREK